MLSPLLPSSLSLPLLHTPSLPSMAPNILVAPGAGSLYLNECGSGAGGPRVIRPHSNFRLFLALDPRHGELSRAMRNRGIELFLLQQQIAAVEAPAAMVVPSAPTTAVAGASQQQQRELCEVLGLAGLPGAALPWAMAATHTTVAGAAAQRHHQAPSLRELRRWAALASALASRGWPAAEAFWVAFQQVYGAASTSGQESAASAAFQYHMLPVLGSLAGSDQVLYRAGTWPLPLGVSNFAEGSALATLCRDAAVLLQHLAAAIASSWSAARSSSSAAERARQLYSGEDAAAVELGLAEAVAVPVGLLRRLLHGADPEQFFSSGAHSSLDAASLDVAYATYCTLAAARVYVERASPWHLPTSAAYVTALTEQLQHCSDMFTECTLARQAQLVAQRLLGHPLTAALAALQLQVASLVQPHDVGVRLMPGGGLPPHLVAAQLSAEGSSGEAGAAAGSLWQQVLATASQVAALQRAVQVAVQLQTALSGAEAAVLRGGATLLQLSFWRYQHPKVGNASCVCNHHPQEVVAPTDLWVVTLAGAGAR